MNHKVKLLQFIIVTSVLILLIGCSSSSQSFAGHNFKQGISEVEIVVRENAPPDELFPNTPFIVAVQVENQAAYDVRNGKVELIGLDPKYFKSSSTFSASFDGLEGRSLTNPKGEIKHVDFGGKTGTLFENAAEYRANFFVKASYDSTMEFTDTICINPKLYQVTDPACETQNQKSYSGQGAPLEVTSLEQVIFPSAGGTKVELRIGLDNGGDGRLNSATITKASLGGKSLKCTFPASENTKSITFEEQNQETIILCDGQLPGQKVYPTILQLAFSYSYEKSVRETVTLINPRDASTFR